MTTLDDAAKRRAEPPSAEAGATRQGAGLVADRGGRVAQTVHQNCLETALNEELTENLGHDKNQAPPDRESTDIRNGARPRTVLTEASGHVPIEAPREAGRDVRAADRP